MKKVLHFEQPMFDFLNELSEQFWLNNLNILNIQNPEHFNKGRVMLHDDCDY